MSQHIPELVRIAQTEMPGLEYDICNASTTLSQKVVIEKLHRILTLVLHHVILDYYESQSPGSQPTPRPAQRAVPAPQPPQPPQPQTSLPQGRAQFLPPGQRPPANVPVVQAIVPSGLPSLPSLSAPVASPAAPAIPGATGDVPHQPGVTNVVITPQGTTVTTPSGAMSRLPAGAIIPIEASADIPTEIPDAPDGVANIVLPRGGGMTPDLMSALASRSDAAPETSADPPTG